jgi:hypothetical protein
MQPVDQDILQLMDENDQKLEQNSRDDFHMEKLNF